MNTNITANQIVALKAALLSIHVREFGSESSDPKYNAQRNLAGKTYYVSDDTLRFHKSRVVSSSTLCGGLLFKVTTSDSLDMRNTSRGFRCAVFDVFGTCVWRPELNNAVSTSAKAEKVCAAVEFDVVTHYVKAIQDKIAHLAASQREHQTALELMQDLPVS